MPHGYSRPSGMEPSLRWGDGERTLALFRSPASIRRAEARGAIGVVE